MIGFYYNLAYGFKFTIEVILQLGNE